MPISSVTVKNYKTIKDASVSFKPGLNIIIGDNGSGKTNFVEILDDVLSVSQDGGYNKFNVKVSFSDGLDLNVRNTINTNINNNILSESYAEYFLTKGLMPSKSINTSRELLSEYYTAKKKFLNHKIIKHGIPTGSLFLDTAVNNSIQIQAEQYKDTSILQLLSVSQHETPFAAYLKNILSINLRSIFELNNIPQYWEKTIESFLSAIKRKINFAPFSDIRISENFAVKLSPTDHTLTVSNFYFEFFQNNRWNSFQQLSDGTKRLIIIFFTLFDPAEIWINEKKINREILIQNDTTIIIEEPELGIHPNQLYQLMLLFQEEARNKQIIITTHSPVALDILEKNDLDSIIICSFDNEKGTILNHLTEIEKEKAIGYLEEVGYLSLYWTHSDLNRTEK